MLGLHQKGLRFTPQKDRQRERGRGRMRDGEYLEEWSMSSGDTDFMVAEDGRGMENKRMRQNLMNGAPFNYFTVP